VEVLIKKSIERIMCRIEVFPRDTMPNETFFCLDESG
jgi:hypothetical protein